MYVGVYVCVRVPLSIFMYFSSFCHFHNVFFFFFFNSLWYHEIVILLVLSASLFLGIFFFFCLFFLLSSSLLTLPFQSLYYLITSSILIKYIRSPYQLSFPYQNNNKSNYSNHTLCRPMLILRRSTKWL